ncbi:MAG: rhamnulokinase, partial [Planctomycetota bacterium]
MARKKPSRSKPKARKVKESKKTKKAKKSKKAKKVRKTKKAKKTKKTRKAKKTRKIKKSKKTKKKKGARKAGKRTGRSSRKKKKPAARGRRPFQAVGVDIGASNGKAVLGELSSDGVLSIRDIRRFPNGMHESDGSLRWDFERLLGEIKGAVDDAFAQGEKPASVGIDTWGVDYALFARDGSLVDKPFAYRDHRTDGLVERFTKEVMPTEELYRITGNHLSQINTLYQLYAETLSGDERLARADRMLLMPDAFARALSGRAVAEYTIASTSQLMDARARKWSDELVGRLGIRREILPELVDPGTRLGPYRTSAGRKLNVVAPAGHDTAAAVAAVPASDGEPWAFVSSGTWSLIGIEVDEPVVTEDARVAGLTNEGSLDGKVRFLANVSGLWLVQECMRMWNEAGAGVDIIKVCEDAGRAPVHGPLVDPDHASFLAPSDMTQAIADYCLSTDQPPPDGVGVTARCVFESLALKTRLMLERIAALTGVDPRVIHMVGGGSRNETLCGMTADAAGRPVVAGPAEATVTGNLLIQARTARRIGSLEEIREVSRNSFDLKT